MKNITAHSTPDFDEWGPDTYWSKEDWQTWMRALVAEYGQVNGADVFYRGWASRTGTWQALGDVRGDWVAFDNSFRDWLQGYTLSNNINLLDAIVDTVSLGDLFKAGDEVASDIGDTLSNAGTALSTTSKTLKYLLPITLIAVVGIGLFFLFKYAKLKTT